MFIVKNTIIIIISSVKGLNRMEGTEESNSIKFLKTKDKEKQLTYKERNNLN